MTMHHFSNFGASILASSIDAVTSSISVVPQDPDRFPSACPFPIRLGSEICYVTSRGTGWNWTVSRGQETTIGADNARVHNAGDPILHDLTAGTLVGLGGGLSLVGDANGPVGATTVTAIQGKPVSSTGPTTIGQTLVWSGSAWAPASPTAPPITYSDLTGLPTIATTSPLTGGGVLTAAGLVLSVLTTTDPTVAPASGVILLGKGDGTVIPSGVYYQCTSEGYTYLRTYRVTGLGFGATHTVSLGNIWCDATETKLPRMGVTIEVETSTPTTAGLALPKLDAARYQFGYDDGPTPLVKINGKNALQSVDNGVVLSPKLNGLVSSGGNLAINAFYPCTVVVQNNTGFTAVAIEITVRVSIPW